MGNITGYVELNQYLSHKGVLYPQCRLFDTKDDFIGWFFEYDTNNIGNIIVDKAYKHVSMGISELKVEIEYKPIWEVI